MTTLHRLPNRQVLRLRGDNALKFVHDVGAQDVAALAAGSGALTAFLNDKGRVRGTARVLVQRDEVILDAGGAQRLDDVLGRIAPLLGVEVVVEEWSGVRVIGDPIVELSHEPYSSSWWHDVLIVRGGWGDEGWDAIGHHVNAVEDLLREDGAQWGDDTRVEETRIAAGRPLWGVDIGEETLINETPLLVHAVSFTKGCYPGQESVARVHNLGQVRRKLRALRLGGSSVAAGDRLISGAKAVSEISSAAGFSALGFLPVEIEDGATLVAGDSVATVTDAGWI